MAKKVLLKMSKEYFFSLALLLIFSLFSQAQPNQVEPIGGITLLDQSNNRHHTPDLLLSEDGLKLFVGAATEIYEFDLQQQSAALIAGTGTGEIGFPIRSRHPALETPISVSSLNWGPDKQLHFSWSSFFGRITNDGFIELFYPSIGKFRATNRKLQSSQFNTNDYQLRLDWNYKYYAINSAGVIYTVDFSDFPFEKVYTVDLKGNLQLFAGGGTQTNTPADRFDFSFQNIEHIDVEQNDKVIIVARQSNFRRVYKIGHDNQVNIIADISNGKSYAYFQNGVFTTLREHSKTISYVVTQDNGETSISQIAEFPEEIGFQSRKNANYAYDKTNDILYAATVVETEIRIWRVTNAAAQITSGIAEWNHYE